MLPEWRIEKLSQWGDIIRNHHWSPVYQKVYEDNPWYTDESLKMAFSGLENYLDRQKLLNWSVQYDASLSKPKTVGIIMAGNIPLVGIHDLICGYLSGHRLQIKCSSQDEILIQELWQLMVKIDPKAGDQVGFVQSLDPRNLDAIIATGSDNTTRYFKYYFADLPGIIRSNRTSIAVIKGTESYRQLENLGLDLYSYFGRGCRNVSKLLIPHDYQLKDLFSPFQKYQYVGKNPVYHSNYRYQKALKSMLSKEFEDNGFSLFLRSAELTSPLGVIYFERYGSLEEVEQSLARLDGKLQCIASAEGWLKSSIPFGKLQLPELEDYADNIDTVKFLLDL